MTVTILLGDVREQLKTLADESVHCVVTSPPYFGLRDYGMPGQIGLEATPAAFVEVMVDVFREVRRVLRADGTLWLNLGDSYANDGKWGGSSGGKHVEALHGESGIGRAKRVTGLKPKDLIGVPWRVAFALQDDGWYLRQDIIWSKPNPMPESVTDRCTKAHEYLFLLSKSARYHFDAEAIAEGAVADHPPGNKSHKGKAAYDAGDGKHRTKQGLVAYSARQRAVPPRHAGLESSDQSGLDEVGRGGKRNKRSVWTVATQPFKEAHFATFPPALIEPCILAGCPKDCCAECGAPVVRDVERVDLGFDGSKYGERAVAASGGAVTGGTAKSTLGSGNGKLVGQSKTVGWSPSCSCDGGTARGVCLDPFGGAGTTGLVADRLGRDAVLIELNPDYAAIAERRIKADSPLFAEVAA